MVQFRIWPTAAAIALLATTAMASAGPTPNDIGTVRPVSPVRRPATLVRHPIAVAPRPVVARRVNTDVSDDVLLARINRIDHENCSMAMRERADIDPAVLAGVIEQRRAECARMRFNPAPFNPGIRRDADDRRFSAARFDDRRDDRQIGRLRSDADDRRISTARFDDRRDDRQVSRLRLDDRRDDRRLSTNRFATNRRFPTNRVAAFHRSSRPMGRPRP